MKIQWKYYYLPSTEDTILIGVGELILLQQPQRDGTIALELLALMLMNLL